MKLRAFASLVLIVRVFAAPATALAQKGPNAHAEHGCPVEVKLLLAPSTTQTVVRSLGFENLELGRVYFFDTDALDLSAQGVIVRVRRGASNDLTVKVRAPTDQHRVDRSPLREQFACEIDRTQTGAVTSYAVRRPYKAEVPESGANIYNRLNAAQKTLLRETGMSINWSRIKKIATINSSTWVTKAKAPFDKLALELWEWPSGKILEISSKSGPGTDASKFVQLERLAQTERLSLSAGQDTKTNIVLRTFVDRTVPP
jgi:hypothetical protein